jgi:hypothetical protein
MLRTSLLVFAGALVLAGAILLTSGVPEPGGLFARARRIHRAGNCIRALALSPER